MTLFTFPTSHIRPRISPYQTHQYSIRKNAGTFQTTLCELVVNQCFTHSASQNVTELSQIFQLQKHMFRMSNVEHIYIAKYQVLEGGDKLCIPMLSVKSLSKQN